MSQPQATATLQQLLDKVGAVILATVQAGADEAKVFDWTREKLAETFGLPPLQAANLTRLALNELSRKHLNRPLYSPEDMKTVISRAFPTT